MLSILLLVASLKTSLVVAYSTSKIKKYLDTVAQDDKVIDFKETASDRLSPAKEKKKSVPDKVTSF